MADLDKNEKNWLVKASSKILGPLSAIEIAQGVIKKHISIIDECRRPETRWNYIRENAIFSEVVQSLRHEQSTHVEETVTTAQNTQTLSRTDWQGSDAGTVTPTPTFTESPQAESDSVWLKDVTQSQNQASGATMKPSSAPSSFGSATDQRVQTQIETSSRNMGIFVWAATAVLMVVVGLIVFKKYNNENRGYDKNIRLALHYNHILLYEKAVEAFHRAQEIHEPDQATSFQLALPVLQTDRHSLWARKVFEAELPRVGMTRDETSDAFIGIGLSYVIDGNLKSALEYFNKVLATDPDNFPANIDLAYNYIKKGDYGLASKIFNALPPSVTYQAYTLYGLGALAAESQNYAHKEVQKLLKDYLQTPRPLRKEIALVLAFLQMTDKNHEGLNATMEAFIHIPPQESADFSFDPRIDRRIIEWDYLERYCSQIFQIEGSTVLGKSFRAMCLLEENRDVEAKKWIDEALAQEPKSVIANLTHAQFLIKGRQLEEAASLLKTTDLQNIAETPLLLGKVCQDLKNMPCALDNLQKSFLQNPNDVTRIFPWAKINQSKEKEKLIKTWELVKKGLENQPQYKPLIELRDQLENQ